MEFVKGIEVKPHLNLQWYQNEDVYSDGDVEDQIIDLLVQNDLENYSEVIMNHCSWPTYYYLTHLRKNIVNWYPFEKDASVLEIGCGLGAVTEALCERCGKVTAVELSKRRATAAQLRCRHQDNLEIIVGNINDIEFEEKFDYITLIGVLEYQGKYTESENPFEDFLINIRKLLKPAGKLLIAIENQYGIKYWCGIPEDHSGIPFDGINQYAFGPKKAKTFSKAALKELIHRSGFGNTFFYYPMPDYKLPTTIYSEAYLPKADMVRTIMPYSSSAYATSVADESAIYGDLIQNHVFEFFANSFLVECGMSSENMGQVWMASVGSERLPEYRVTTTILQDGIVRKEATNGHGMRHLQQIADNTEELQNRSVKVLPIRMENQALVMDYCDMPSLDDKLHEAYASGDENQVYDWFDRIKEQICLSSPESNQNVIYQLKLADEGSPYEFGPLVKKGYLDMIIRNAFVEEDNTIVWFDQEWTLENVPVSFILYRNIMEVYCYYPEYNKKIPMEQLLERYRIAGLEEIYDKLNALFNNSILDTAHMKVSGVFRNLSGDMIVHNISKLLGLVK